jgi:beta-mannosidase
MGRFISEFGMHAAPVRETLQRAIPADQLFHHSPAMDWHNKDNPKNKGDNLMLGVTGLPESLEEYIDFSMIAQAEGLKFGIEHFRRRKPHCSGTLVWQLNDCWPALSWSVLDYYGSGKAGYFYLKRVFSPVLASFKALPDGGLELWITNDSRSPVRDEVAVRLAGFDGVLALEERLTIDVTANTSQAVASWTPAVMTGGPERYLSVRSSTNVFPVNRHFFVPIKDLVRTPGTPELSTSAVSAHELSVTVSAPADRYAYFVHLTAPPATRFSDNYFDLEPGEQRVITVTNAESDLSPRDVMVAGR